MTSTWKLVEDFVDPAGEHIDITYGDDTSALARVAPGGDMTFSIEFLATPTGSKELSTKLESIRQELNYYLVEKGEENPWAYAVYHCGTATNLYSPVHWRYVCSPTQNSK